ESALMLWNALYDKEFEAKDVVALLLDRYEVEESQAKADAQKWIDTLKECKLIE
ncbi:MAG: PqqD family protein, partial [Alistipes sp.]|nr:PqqD family protein [Alistipes sp.]